jgi:hypothetical protein
MAAQSARHCDLLVQVFEGIFEYTEACVATPFSIPDCRAAMYKYLQSMKAINVLWRAGVPEDAQGHLPWHLRPKAHVCQHMVEEKIEAFGSPNAFWGYRDEDFVGACKNIANKTQHPKTLERRMIEKLRILAVLG